MGRSDGRGRGILQGHDKQVQALAFTPDGRALASGNVVGVVKLWDVVSGTEQATLNTRGKEVNAVAFAPDGRTLAVAVDRGVQLWDVGTGRLRTDLEGHQGKVKCLAYSPNGTRLASGSSDKTVRLWEVTQQGRSDWK